MSALPLDFPGLQTEAQRLTVEFLGLDPTGHEAARVNSTAAPAVRAFARLLADLDRAESRDRWAALMAAKLGLPEGFTAPGFGFDAPYYDEACAWFIRSGGQTRYFRRAPMDWMYAHLDIVIPGLPETATGRPEAFRLALCAVFGVAP